jgi:hypothetical protein
LYEEKWFSSNMRGKKMSIIGQGPFKTSTETFRGLAAGWTASNPVLMAGQFGIEIDTNKFKIGDGVTAWNDLSYGFGASTPQAQPDLATVATSGQYSDLLGKPTLSTVALSGSYSDLSNKPSIPTATSQLTNDAGFITSVPAAQVDLTMPIGFTTTPYTVGQVLAVVALGAYSFPVGLAGSVAVCGTAATANTSCFVTIKRAGATVASGKVDFAAGANTGTFEFASAFTSQVGDVLTITASTDAADTTFASPSITLMLKRA